jgi:mRNA-degrading endonuclease YafQ of YafQ-DinJ toxin-antitoxin module
MHTAELLVPDLVLAIAKLKRYKSPGSDQIPAELINTHAHARTHTLTTSFWNKENCQVSGSCLLLYQITGRAIKLIVAIIVEYHCYQLHTKCYAVPFSQG